MQVDTWSPDNVAVGVVDPEGVRDWHGDEAREFRLASITKPVVALATLVAAEEGVVDLDEEAGPPGSTTITDRERRDVRRGQRGRDGQRGWRGQRGRD